MSEYPAGTLLRAGEKLALRVDDEGNWLARAASRELKQPTRARLVSEIDRVLRLEKKAVHIPITVVDNKNNGYVGLKHGVVTGVHSGSGNLLVSWDDGSNGQLTGYSLTVLNRLDAAEETELKRLTALAYNANEKLREFTSRRHVTNGERGLKRQVEDLLAKDGG